MSMQTEPARIVGYLAAIISAGIPLAAFYLGWSPEHAERWEQFAIALAALVPLFIGVETIRRGVWSPKTHDEAVMDALHELPPIDEEDDG